MKNAFTNFRINKNVDRKGVNLLMKNLHKRTTASSVVVFTTMNQTEESEQYNWMIEKKKTGKFKYVCLDNNTDDSLKTAILNLLSKTQSIVVIIVCDMKQKLDKKTHIKEMWGYKVTNKDKKTTLEEITSEDIYTFSTININTGKSMPPAKEIVYCGPDGKICGWDMI